MKTTKTIACLLLLAAPALAWADATTDRNIEKKANESYNYTVVLEGNVTAKADDGKVTLTGTVPDADHRVLAEDTVREIEGVASVNNKIKVEETAPEMSDAWIATKARTKLLLSGHVSILKTDVAVKDGVVTLTGTANNKAQKELTTAYVSEIEGVKSVDNKMTVKTETAEKRTLSDRIDDASITAQVKFQLLTNDGTSALDTNVTTKEGVVSVTGKADSAAERALVTHIASKVNGVKSVDNKMTVKS